MKNRLEVEPSKWAPLQASIGGWFICAVRWIAVLDTLYPAAIADDFAVSPGRPGWQEVPGQVRRAMARIMPKGSRFRIVPFVY